MVDRGEFREDLYYRLYVVVIRVPPLRERTDDIPLLIQHFIREFSAENGKPIEGISPEAVEILTRQAWPGNVRELRNVLERMVVLARGDKLTARDIPAGLKAEGAAMAAGRLSGDLSLEEAEKQMIIKALDTHGGNRSSAAKQLGISRRTLHRKLNAYGLREREAGPAPPG
jgi:two-component system response regulator HydG